MHDEDSMHELIIPKRKFEIVMKAWLILMQPFTRFAWQSLWLVINMLGIWKVNNTCNNGSLFSIATHSHLSINLIML